MDSQLTKFHPINWYGARREIKRACNGSNKQEALEGVWLVTSVQKMLGEIISPEQSKTKGEWWAFVTRVSQQEMTLAFWLTTIVVLKGGLTSSFPRSSSDSWIFDWRCGRTIASSRRITCLIRKDKLSIEAPSVTCFGLVTYRVKGWHFKTGCVLILEDN